MSKKEAALFWNTAHRYLDHQLKLIRQVNEHTISSYRDSLNCFIDYLEQVMKIGRAKVTFNNFDKKTLKGFQSWMIIEKQLSPKTCNLRMTAIRSFLEYASQEHLWLTETYMNACTIVNVIVPNRAIEYFEPDEMKALLAVPSTNKKTDRRNRMILIFLYDTAARVSEARGVRLSDLHLDAEIPYVTLLGKGKKYRNIPLMDKTVRYIRNYLKEFHLDDMKSDVPLFYSRSHGQIHHLSSDTFEKMIKRYANQCREQGQCMPENVHCHMIRKTRAMDLYREGVPLAHIQQILGHENISTTSGFYAFATLDVIAEALESANPDEGKKKWEDPEILEALHRF